jgi:hypothetical protein
MAKKKYIPPCCLQCRIYQRVECTNVVKVPRRNCFYFEPGCDYSALEAEYYRANPQMFKLADYDVSQKAVN